MTRTFHLSDVLSVSTGSMVSLRHMDGIYDVLGYLTGDVLWTHQLPRASAWAKPGLLAQHPWLTEIDAPATVHDEATLRAWLEPLIARYGENVELEPIDGWMHVNPVEELCDMVGPDRVLVVAPGECGQPSE